MIGYLFDTTVLIINLYGGTYWSTKQTKPKCEPLWVTLAVTIEGRSQGGGSWGARDPPLCKAFLWRKNLQYSVAKTPWR